MSRIFVIASEAIQSVYKQLKFKKDAGLLRFARNDKNSAQRLIYATTLLSQGMTPNLVISQLSRCVYPDKNAFAHDKII